MPPSGTGTAYVVRRVLQLVEEVHGPAQMGNTSIMSRTLEHLAPEVPLLPWRLLLGSRELFRPLITTYLALRSTTNAAIRTTAAVTVVQAGGGATNVLPGSASVTVNVRVVPGETLDDVLDRFHRLLHGAFAALPDVVVRLSAAETPVPRDPSPLSAVTSPAYKTVAAAIRGTFPGGPGGASPAFDGAAAGSHRHPVLVVPALMVANTDSFHYWNLTRSIFRFNPVALRAADLARIHGAGERVGKRAYLDALTFYHNLFRLICE